MALVIGNGAYAHVTALANPPNDARAVAKSLRDIGFERLRGHRSRPRRDAEDDAGLPARPPHGRRPRSVYYAGHGVQFDGRNYLVPVDVRAQAGRQT